MMRWLLVFALALAALAAAADRVVLLEDFTNSGCGPCWSFEPTLNSFVNDHLAAGDLAVIRVHVSWPSANDPIYLANPTEQNARKSYYGVNAVPWIQFDGVIKASTSGAGLNNAFNNRIDVPTNLSIFVARNGDDQTGTISVGLVAEDEIETSVPIRLFATVVEDEVPGAGYWSGDYFYQAFRKNLFGVAGPEVDFSGPYPDTIYFETEYDITDWVADNLHLATFVQEYSSSDKEVINARYDKFMDLQTGIEGGWLMPQSPQMTLGPNPSSGTVSVTPMLPEGAAGTVTVYDVSGRRVAAGRAVNGVPGSFDLGASGVYLVRLTTDSGAAVSRTVAVIR
ncbi:MAG: T9SS type A sorting domain-containing protein [Candidatus Fermentibacteraceae bacterium]